MVIQCKNLISLYILPDQRRVNLLVYYIVGDQKWYRSIKAKHKTFQFIK